MEKFKNKITYIICLLFVVLVPPLQAAQDDRKMDLERALQDVGNNYNQEENKEDGYNDIQNENQLIEFLQGDSDKLQLLNIIASYEKKLVKLENEVIIKNCEINKCKNQLAEKFESQLNDQPNTSLREITCALRRIERKLSEIEIRLDRLEK